MGPDDNFCPKGFGGQSAPEHTVPAGTDGNDDTDAMLRHNSNETRNDKGVVFVPEKILIDRNAKFTEVFRQGAGVLETDDDRPVFAGLNESLDQSRKDMFGASRPETMVDKHYSGLVCHDVRIKIQIPFSRPAI